jgi:hypothetical protein
MAKMITIEIARKCDSIVDLSNIYSEWGDSFDHIHAAAALVKCDKLPGGGRSSLVDKLCSTWLTQLPLAGLQGCANVLWACVRLGPGAVQRLWGPTWEVYIAQLQQESTVKGGCVPQDLANPLWACAKLRKQPSVDELRLLVQAFLLPAVLKDAKPQELSNVVWALGELCRMPRWQGGVSEQGMQQLLGQQQLQVLASDDSGQATSNVLLGLAHIAASKPPLVSASFACTCSRQLLMNAYSGVRSWTPQHIANAMWACGELRLADTPFIEAAVAAAPKWVPRSAAFHLNQASSACAVLKHRDERFISVLLQHALQLLRQQPQGKPGSSSMHKSLADRDRLAAYCSSSVARLDLQSLAGPARELVFVSGVGQRPATHKANLSRLWVLHSWLLQHQLLDGRGLTGLLTQQQLQQGAKEAAAYGLC